MAIQDAAARITHESARVKNLFQENRLSDILPDNCRFIRMKQMIEKEMDLMTNLDLAYTSATELVHLIREKQISPVEIIQNSLERIQSVNSKLNCFCFTYPEDYVGESDRPAAWASCGFQGLDAHQGENNHNGFLYLRTLGSGLQCNHR
jgi:hypothetical protein